MRPSFSRLVANHFFADGKLKPMLLGNDMRTYDTGERAFVSDRHRAMAQRLGVCDRFLNDTFPSGSYAIPLVTSLLVSS